MKKTLFTILATGLIAVSVKAQTIQDGMNHLYADRFKSATDVFQKLLTANPNNGEAIFWQGQVYFDMDDNAKAKDLYKKALETIGSQPTILVGMGHIDLLENKMADAKAKFEAALAASNTKKGPDPLIQTLIGRALVDVKGSDYNWAVQLLEAAHLANPKNTETILQLGNAYRKQGEGSGGGRAFETYKKAFAIDPSFAVVDLRLAKMFETQKNWDLVLDYLNSAAKRDPKFAPAYYELFYYYFFRKKYTEAEEQLVKYIANSDPSWENDYLQAQLSWAKQDFASAISKAEGVVSLNGAATKPRVYKLLADAYAKSKNFAAAKKYIDLYMQKEKEDEKLVYDYKLLVDILKNSNAAGDEIVVAYQKGAKADSVLSGKIDFLKEGIVYFKENKMRDKEAVLIQDIIPLRKTPIINDYFDLALAQYFIPDYAKSRETAVTMRDKFTDQVYGYDWAVNNSKYLDSVKMDSIYVPDLLKLETFAAQDTAKYKKQYLSATRTLAVYYYSNAKDKAKAIEYFTKWKSVDAANAATIDTYIKAAEVLKPPTKAVAAPPASKPTVTKPKTVAAVPAKPVVKPIVKPAVVKKTPTSTKAVVKK